MRGVQMSPLRGFRALGFFGRLTQGGGRLAELA
jgi:hypothetical protein